DLGDGDAHRPDFPRHPDRRARQPLAPGGLDAARRAEALAIISSVKGDRGERPSLGLGMKFLRLLPGSPGRGAAPTSCSSFPRSPASPSRSSPPRRPRSSGRSRCSSRPCPAGSTRSGASSPTCSGYGGSQPRGYDSRGGNRGGPPHPDLDVLRAAALGLSGHALAATQPLPLGDGEGGSEPTSPCPTPRVCSMPLDAVRNGSPP